MHWRLRAVRFRKFSIFVEDAFFDKDSKSLLWSRSTLLPEAIHVSDEFGKILVAHAFLLKLPYSIVINFMIANVAFKLPYRASNQRLMALPSLQSPKYNLVFPL